MAGKKIGGAPAEKAATKKTAAKANDGKVQVSANKENYVTTKAASGSKSLHNNDPVAQALDGLLPDEVYAIADEFYPDNDFRKRYANLNPGMQRMNVGNRLRKGLHGEDADVTKFENKLKRVAAPHQKAAKARLAEKAKGKGKKAA